MDAFEYLSVLISIVLGLGITQLLVGFARWLEQRSAFKAYGPAIAWAAFLLLVHIQSWWSMYALHRFTEWSFLQFALVLLQPAILFLLATIVFPGASAPVQDLRVNFQDQRPWFFGLLIGLVVVSLTRDVARNGTLPSAGNLAFHLAFSAACTVGLVTRRDAAQQLLAYVSLFGFLVYIALLFTTLQA